MALVTKHKLSQQLYQLWDLFLSSSCWFFSHLYCFMYLHSMLAHSKKASVSSLGWRHQSSERLSWTNFWLSHTHVILLLLVASPRLEESCLSRDTQFTVSFCSIILPFIQKSKIFWKSKVEDPDLEIYVVYPIFIGISVDSTNGEHITDKQPPLSCGMARVLLWQNLLKASFQCIIYLIHVVLEQTALCKATEIRGSGTTVGETNKTPRQFSNFLL